MEVKFYITQKFRQKICELKIVNLFNITIKILIHFLFSFKLEKG